MMNLHHWHRAPIGMGPWRNWLTDHGSLTLRLQGRCPSFRVQRLNQTIDMPFRDEAAALGMPRNRRALVREVLLLCGSRPLVFAHTVIPLDGLRGPWRALAGLGNQSLGATLFADPKVMRFPLEFSRLTRQDPLFRHAMRHHEGALPSLWARRSLFSLGGSPIMVSEVFLPAVLRLTACPGLRR